jgi:hypothetical protein
MGVEEILLSNPWPPHPSKLMKIENNFPSNGFYDEIFCAQ